MCISQKEQLQWQWKQASLKAMKATMTIFILQPTMLVLVVLHGGE